MLGSQAIHIIAMHTPGLNSVLQIEPVSPELWSQLLSVSLILIIVDETHKYWHNLSNESQAIIPSTMN